MRNHLQILSKIKLESSLCVEFLVTLEKKKAVPIVIEGLKILEYRGYDSAGIAGIQEGKTLFYKDIGKVDSLAKMIARKQLKLKTAIAHTRWATHGGVDTKNCSSTF